MDINEIKNWYDGYSFEEVESAMPQKSLSDSNNFPVFLGACSSQPTPG